MWKKLLLISFGVCIGFVLAVGLLEFWQITRPAVRVLNAGCVSASFPA